MTYFLSSLFGALIGSVVMMIHIDKRNRKKYEENLDLSESEDPVPPRPGMFYDNEQSCWVEGYQPKGDVDRDNPPKSCSGMNYPNPPKGREEKITLFGSSYVIDNDSKNPDIGRGGMSKSFWYKK